MNQAGSCRRSGNQTAAPGAAGTGSGGKFVIVRVIFTRPDAIRAAAAKKAAAKRPKTRTNPDTVRGYCSGFCLLQLVPEPGTRREPEPGIGTPAQLIPRSGAEMAAAGAFHARGQEIPGAQLQAAQGRTGAAAEALTGRQLIPGTGSDPDGAQLVPGEPGQQPGRELSEILYFKGLAGFKIAI